MLLNVDRLQKQLDKDKFKEDGSMTAFWVVNNQFQKFIDSQFIMDYDSQMTDKCFVEYTGIEVKHFRGTLLQHMGNVKKSVAERTRHQRHGTESEVQDNSSRSGNDTYADDVDIRPIYDEEPMAEYTEPCQVQSPMLDSSPDNLTTDYSKQSREYENILLKKTVAQFQKDFLRMEAHCIALELKYQNQALKSGQHGQILNEESNKAEIKKEINVLETINIELEHKVANFHKENETLKKHYKDFSDSEKGFCNCCFKNDLRKLQGNNVDTKFDKTSVLGKPVLQSLRNQSVVRQLNAFKSERPQMLKPRFVSQVDVTNNLSRPVTQHYLPNKKEYAFAKPDHMIASSSSRNSSKNMPRFSSNDMVYNHYLGHRFSPNKTSVVYEKTSPRSDLRWKPTGRIFKSVGLRWIPTRKLFDSRTSKVDSEPTHGSNVDIPNIHESKQTLDLSVGTSINVQKEESLDLSVEVPSTDTIVMTSMIELESLFDPLFDEYFNGENKVVSKPFAVTTVDTSDKRQQQPDSTSSTSTLATTVTADGNFDL
nr:hypothetical protein [Tanacetum cinerariifolium]